MSIKTVLMDATEEELAEAVQRNLFALFGAMATVLPEAEIVMGPGLSYHHALPTNPMFKGVWGTQLASEDVEVVMDHIIAWFRARNAPYFFWWTGPDTTPDDLGTRLQVRGMLDMTEQQRELAAGIKQTTLGAPGMVADLNQMNEAVLTQTPTGFTIVKISDEQGLYDFKQVFVDTYQIPDWAGQAWVDATLAVGIGETPWCIYVGYLDGEPVATNMLFTGGGVAGLYAVATVPAAQGRGIGAAISLKPLLDARDKGYHYGVLFSTEMGVRLYQRIGFRLTDVRINRYLWRE
jgi:GNAT superfamily N-acetyltransferase